MKSYTICVQLNGNAPGEIYDRLHGVMERIGAARTIVADDGQRYWLPHGEYDFSALENTVAVQRTMSATVKTIWADCEVFVTEAGVRAWSGLRPANVGAGLFGALLR